MIKVGSEFTIAMGLDETPGELGTDVFDTSAPFSELWRFQATSRGDATKLVKAIEATTLQENILGVELVRELDARAEKAAQANVTALSKRVAETANRIADDLLAKASRIVANAPLRKRAVVGIVGDFKQALLRNGHREGVEDFGSDGWERLSASMEQFVNESLAVA